MPAAAGDRTLPAMSDYDSPLRMDAELDGCGRAPDASGE
jgi:hypothetical protein